MGGNSWAQSDTTTAADGDPATNDSASDAGNTWGFDIKDDVGPTAGNDWNNDWGESTEPTNNDWGESTEPTVGDALNKSGNTPDKMGDGDSFGGGRGGAKSRGRGKSGKAGDGEGGKKEKAYVPAPVAPRVCFDLHIIILLIDGIAGKTY
jgi:hypothetical protein